MENYIDVSIALSASAILVPDQQEINDQFMHLHNHEP